MWNMWERPRWLTNIFHVFIWVLNKCVCSFPSFLGGSWTCLDFCFLPLPAALDCARCFCLSSQNCPPFTKSLTASVWLTTHPPVLKSTAPANTPVWSLTFWWFLQGKRCNLRGPEIVVRIREPYILDTSCQITCKRQTIIFKKNPNSTVC